MNGVAPAPVTWLQLVGLLVRLRWRTLWNGLKRGPQARAPRLMALFGLVVPLAYVSLFASAFASLGESGGARQEAALALVAGCIALSSLASKVAGGEAVLGQGGEGEFLLARPVSLAQLAVARGVAGVATDLFDALLLLPVLLAAALVWGLGPAAVVVALAASVLVQVVVSALAQAGQILVVQLIPPHARRLVWSMLALATAGSMALVWMVGTTILRSREEAGHLLDSLSAIAALARPVVLPLRALRAGDARGVLAAMAGLAVVAGAALLIAAAVARIASRRGWEQAGAPWAEAHGGRPARAPLSLFGKDRRLLQRDSSRLVMLVAMPVLFIGVLVFGSAGWGWSTTGAARRALCAYSLAAYAATFGPLQHMEAERRAFWILLSAPVPLGRLLAWKATFWSALVGGLCAAIYLALSIAAPLGPPGEALGYGALAVAGAVTISWLAVGLAAGAADLSADDRRAVGMGTGYLFMLLAGLFNLAIVPSGTHAGLDRVRALLLYATATATIWGTGVASARDAFDPPVGPRPVSATAGAIGAVLLLLGVHVSPLLTATIGVGGARAFGLSWLGLIGAGAAVHLVRHQRPAPRRSVTTALLAAVVLGGAAGLAARPLPSLATGPLALQALAEELTVRGILQAGLGVFAPPPVAALGSVVAAWAVSPAPFTAFGCASALVPALVFLLGGRLSAALLARAALVVAALA